MTEPLDPSLSFAQFLETRSETEAPVPRDEDWANAKLAKLAALQAKIRAGENFAIRQHDSVDAWLTEVNGPLIREADEITLALQDYTLAVRTETGKATLKLPNGILKTAAKQKGWVFDDEFTEWAKTARPDLLKTTYAVDRRAAKDAFILDSDGNALDPQSGEMVPGARQIEPDEPYTITVTPKEEK